MKLVKMCLIIILLQNIDQYCDHFHSPLIRHLQAYMIQITEKTNYVMLQEKEMWDGFIVVHVGKYNASFCPCRHIEFCRDLTLWQNTLKHKIAFNKISLRIRGFVLYFVKAGPMKIRLVGDPTKKAVVEIYDGNSRWGRICADNWKFWHAQIICNHFGYATTLGAIVVKANDLTYLTNESTTYNFIRVYHFLCPNSNITSLFTHCTDAMTTECECSHLSAGVTCQARSDLG